MEKIVVNRRKFLYLASATVLYSVVPDVFSGNTEDIIDTRRKSLEHLVRSNPSPYVGQVFYDHEGYLIREMPNRLSDKILNDNNIYRDLVGDLTKGSEEKEKIRGVEFLLSSAGKDYIRNQINEGFKGKIEWLKTKDAGTPTLNIIHGRGLKSDIYFFKSCFEPEWLDWQGKVLEVPVKAKLQVSYSHERLHAKYISEGLKLGKVKVDWTNITQLSDEVSLFIMETSVYMDNFELYSSSNNIEKFFAAHDMLSFFNYTKRKISNITEFEAQLLKRISERYKPLVGSALPFLKEYIKKY